MSSDDYENILKTMDIQSNKSLMKRLAKADREKESGGGRSLEDLKKEIEIV